MTVKDSMVRYLDTMQEQSGMDRKDCVRALEAQIRAITGLTAKKLIELTSGAVSEPAPAPAPAPEPEPAPKARASRTKAAKAKPQAAQPEVQNSTSDIASVMAGINSLMMTD